MFAFARSWGPSKWAPEADKCTLLSCSTAPFLELVNNCRGNLLQRRGSLESLYEFVYSLASRSINSSLLCILDILKYFKFLWKVGLNYLVHFLLEVEILIIQSFKKQSLLLSFPASHITQIHEKQMGIMKTYRLSHLNLVLNPDSH